MGERFLIEDRTKLEGGLQCDMEKNSTDIHSDLCLKSLCRAYLWAGPTCSDQYSSVLAEQ